jgi:hypothetical protein
MFTDLTFSGDVTDGKLTLSDEASYRRQMRQFKSGKVTIRIEVDRGKRSNQANRYLWLIYNLIADSTGDDPNSLHDFFKRRFLPPLVVTVLGQELEVWSTAGQDPEAFDTYVKHVRQFALDELGVATPDPDPALRGRTRHHARDKVRAA